MTFEILEWDILQILRWSGLPKKSNTSTTIPNFVFLYSLNITSCLDNTHYTSIRQFLNPNFCSMRVFQSSKENNAMSADFLKTSQKTILEWMTPFYTLSKRALSWRNLYFKLSQPLKESFKVPSITFGLHKFFEASIIHEREEGVGHVPLLQN